MSRTTSTHFRDVSGPVVGGRGTGSLVVALVVCQCDSRGELLGGRCRVDELARGPDRQVHQRRGYRSRCCMLSQPPHESQPPQPPQRPHSIIGP